MNVTHIGRVQHTISGTARRLDNDASGTILDRVGKQRVLYAEVQIQDADIRVTHDGSTAPVAATTGTIWYKGQIKRIWGLSNIEALKMIKDTGTDAVVVENFYGTTV